MDVAVMATSEADLAAEVGSGLLIGRRVIGGVGRTLDVDHHWRRP